MLFSSQSEVPNSIRLEAISEIAQGRLPDENPTRIDVGIGCEEALVELLQPRRRVDRVADHDVFGTLGAAEHARHRRAGEDPDSHASRRPILLAPSAAS